MKNKINRLKDLIVTLKEKNEKCSSSDCILTDFETNCFISINKQLVKAQRELRNLLNNALSDNKITIEQYRLFVIN